jgi:anti-sigma factor RsiW
MSEWHAGNLLSALLDGELTPTEASQVRAHLGTCERCQKELAFVGGARTFVRDLPTVEPPFGLFERAGRANRRWSSAAVGLLAAGAAASVAVVALVAPRDTAVTPPVARYVDAHTATASAVGDPLSEFTPEAVPVSFSR